MSSATVRKSLQDYFASMNSITRKFMEDPLIFEHDRGLLGLCYDESSDKCWKKLIEPSVLQNYQSVPEVADKLHFFPVLHVDSGEKLVIDEDTSNGRPFGSSWKDEHSAPFSWGTKSQQNLHLLLDENGDVVDSQPRTPKTPPSARSCKRMPTPKATPRPSPRPSPALNRKGIKVSDEEAVKSPVLTKDKLNDKLSVSATFPRKLEKPAPDNQIPLMSQTLKPTAPKPPVEIIIVKQADSEIAILPTVIPDELINEPVTEKEVEPDARSETSDELDMDNPAKSIPKTGFDFLDNW